MYNIINPRTVTRLQLRTKKLEKPVKIYNMDGTHNHYRTITYVCNLLVSRGDKKDWQRFYVTGLGKDCLILGYPWFRAFNPDINWPNMQLKGPKVKAETLMIRTLQQACQLREQWKAKELSQVTTSETCKDRILRLACQLREQWKAELNKVTVSLLEEITAELEQEVCNPWSGVTLSKMTCGQVEINHAHTTADMAHKYALEHGQKEVTLLLEFKQHMALFSDKEANKFPPSHKWDHKIELMENALASFNCRTYPLSKKEQATEDTFLDKNLVKGYITPLESPYGFPTFMISKKDSDEMHYIIDYWPLNTVTQ